MHKKSPREYLREPPEELMKSLISLVESWASKSKSWLIIASATKSSMLFPKKTILSLRSSPMASVSAPLWAASGVCGPVIWTEQDGARVLEGLRAVVLRTDEAEGKETLDLSFGWKFDGFPWELRRPREEAWGIRVEQRERSSMDLQHCLLQLWNQEEADRRWVWGFGWVRNTEIQKFGEISQF